MNFEQETRRLQVAFDGNQGTVQFEECADLNGDFKVGVDDLLYLLQFFRTVGTQAALTADLNKDEGTNIFTRLPCSTTALKGEPVVDVAFKTRMVNTSMSHMRVWFSCECGGHFESFGTVGAGVLS